MKNRGEGFRVLENGKLATLNIRDILPNRFQPRIHFDEVKLNELAESIRKYGLIQPIVVRQIGTKYEIIAGERRYKASTLANKETIPAIIVTLSDRDSEEIALLENIQREDLTPIEEAVSYKRILDVGYISQEELANKIGKSQVAIANKIRLLNLDDAVQDALLHGRISERHARSLLKIHSSEKQVQMLNRIINERLTVKMTDREIKNMLILEDSPKEKLVETLSTSDKPVRKAVPVSSHRIIKVNPPKELMDSLNKKKEERVDTMDIDKILEEAQDITPPEEAKPVADMTSLMQQNPNTVTSPLITNQEPIVPVTEPAIEPGKFVTPNVSNEAPTVSEGVPSSNVSFDNVFNANPIDLNNQNAGVGQESVGINDNASLNIPSTETPQTIGDINNTVFVNDSLNNMEAQTVNNNDVNSTDMPAQINPISSTVNMMSPETSQIQAAPQEIISDNGMNNINTMPIQDNVVSEPTIMNDTVTSPSAVDSLATEVAPEVANDNLSNGTWPSTDVNTTVSTIDNMATPTVPVPENPVASATIPTMTPVMPNLQEATPFTEPPTVSPVMPNVVSQPEATLQSESAIPSMPTETPQIPILPGIPGAPLENFNSGVNMNIPDDNILEENTSSVQTPEQVNNTLDTSANFRQVINLIRNCASEIEKLGFYIDTDEIDLGEKYQVTFKIDK